MENHTMDAAYPMAAAMSISSAEVAKRFASLS
jgi:hypothetical protein